MVCRLIPIPGSETAIRAYLFFHFLGLVAFVVVGLCFTARRPALRKHIWALGFVLGLCDLVVAHLARQFLDAGWSALWSSQSWHPLGGGYWGAPLFFVIGGTGYLLLFKLSLREVGDVIAIAWCAAYVFFKGACFLHGCCWGPRSAKPWLAPFFNAHPLPLYEMVLMGITLLILLFFGYHRGLWRGRLAIVLGLLFGIEKVALEPLRYTGRAWVGAEDVITDRQLIGLAAAVFCGTILLLEQRARWRYAHPSAVGMVDQETSHARERRSPL